MLPKRKNIMRRFRITEISGADLPAQEGALVAIIKRHTEGNGEMTVETAKRIDLGALALFALECAANALQKDQPNLSREQRFAKAFADNPEIAAIERRESRARLYGAGVGRDGTPRARTEPAILQEFDGLDADDVYDLVEEEIEKNPYLTPKEAYQRLLDSPAMREHRAKLKAALQAARADARLMDAGAYSRVDEAIDGDLRKALLKRDVACDELRAKAAELRKADPRLSDYQAFAKAYADPANRGLVARHKAGRDAALYAA